MKVDPRIRIVALLITAALVCPLSATQADEATQSSRQAFASVFKFLKLSVNWSKSKHTKPAVKQRSIASLSQLASDVTSVRLCPRRLSLYVSEDFRLSPLPLDINGQPVHGLTVGWSSSDTSVGEVASDGTVKAIGSGQCVITATIGNTKSSVSVEVRDGIRQQLTNAQWDAEHANDCVDPEKDPDESSSGSNGRRCGPCWLRHPILTTRPTSAAPDHASMLSVIPASVQT